MNDDAWEHDSLDERRVLAERFAMADLSAWSRVGLFGEDRRAFLHNLCTNDIKKLEDGHGREAMLCDAKGRVLFHVLIFARREALALWTIPGAARRLAAHLDRYLIRERVQVRDHTEETSEWLVAGPKAEATLVELTGQPPPSEDLASAPITIEGREAWISRVETAFRRGFLVDVARSDGDWLRSRLVAFGAERVGELAVESARLEAGFPRYGVDIGEKNLPQEVGRDRLAINFNKGCYLGQETVARLDALGHVNKLLVRLRFDDSAAPPSGTELRSHGARVGEVTSAAPSLDVSGAVGLGYVAHGRHTPGTRLESDVGECEIVAAGDSRPR